MPAVLLALAAVYEVLQTALGAGGPGAVQGPIEPARSWAAEVTSQREVGLGQNLTLRLLEKKSDTGDLSLALRGDLCGVLLNGMRAIEEGARKAYHLHQQLPDEHGKLYSFELN